ncbi:unnamed protein product [Pleuronectes platessa]|uniref:Uncharacterized protein n=1 Tax=Pleuronectes platessa TaxID=8262 RepID=A0A9N7UAY7_PLEPL|nr:unnamed protein product [Pleuronectes platessa]
MGFGQKRTTEQLRFWWKNLKARATKDHAEAKNSQTGNNPYKRGEYTDIVLDIIGGEKSEALHGIQDVAEDETERAEVQIHLAEEQLILARLLQTKARLEIRLLKAKLGQAGRSTADEADDDDEEEGELIRRTTHNKN